MAVCFRSALAALLLGIAGIIPAAGQVRADEPTRSRSIDPARLPPNAVIIISDKPSDALNNVDAVVLTPDEYKKLLAAAEQGKRLAATDRPEPPSVCKLSGAIERRGSQDVAVLRAVFQFRTTAPRAMVLLGLQKAQPVSATIDDGKTANLVPLKDDNGLAVLVDVPGDHRAVIDVEAPLAVRGGNGSEREIELGLPGAAITTIQRLVLPADISRVRIGGRSLGARQLASGTEKAPAVLLGPTNRLDLAWDVLPAANVEPQTFVDGRYDVRVEDHALAIRARLTLKVQSGAVGTWEVQAPQSAEVSVDNVNADNPIRIQKPSNANKPWSIRRDPSATDLVLNVSVRTPLTPGQLVTVPVFAIPGAMQQRGTITVASPASLKLQFRPGPDVLRREPADETSHDAVFAFFRVPAEGSPLTIEIQSAHGEVETQVGYQLTLAERGWRWQGKLDVRPVRTEVTSFEVEVPAEWQDLRATSAEIVEAIVPVLEAAGRRVVRVQLAEPHRKPFSVTLEALFPLAGSVSTANLTLPRPFGTLDRGGQVVAAVPAGLELRGSYREWEGDRVGEWDRPFEPSVRGVGTLSAAVDRIPARVDLSWRTPRADIALTAAADIQLAERQATVRHQWKFPAAASVPRQFVARGPASLVGRLRVVDGGTVSQSGPGEWSVQIGAPTGRETVLVMTYSFSLPSRPDQADVAVPLVWLDPGPRCETDVRVYSTTTRTGELLPAGAIGPWTEIPARPVPDRLALPDLTLHGSGTNLPLALRLTEAAAGRVNGPLIDRLTIQAVIESDGRQAYRTRCVVRTQTTQYLDVRLPDTPESARFAARLDGKRLPWTVTDDPSRCCVRIRLDPADPNRTASELDLVYVLAGGLGWRIMLTPPVFVGPVLIGPARWQIGVAADVLLFDAGSDASFDWRWDWQRGLLTPRNAWAASEGPRGTAADRADAVLSTWQTVAAPLYFVAVPRPLALFLGSLSVIALGLAATRVSPIRRVVGAFVAGAGLICLAMIRPQNLAVLLYIVQPGVAVVVALIVGRWLARRRYRRRVLFLPTFAETAANGSGVARNGNSDGRARQDSATTDAPAHQLRSEG
jgi:hypothetical protein